MPVCLRPPHPVCREFSGTRASICEARGLLCSPGPGPTFPSYLQLPGAWLSLDTITHEPERQAVGNRDTGSWAPASSCPLPERPGPFVPVRMGSGLGPVLGLCTGETPQETGLAKWPPFPFSSLGHDCAVSLPEEAQGGRPPSGALSAPGWCPQALRRQGWPGHDEKVGGQCMCVCPWGDWGAEPVSQWWTRPDLGAGVLPMCGVLISIFLPVSAWFVMIAQLHPNYT